MINTATTLKTCFATIISCLSTFTALLGSLHIESCCDVPSRKRKLLRRESVVMVLWERQHHGDDDHQVLIVW